jgi:hypothetical protein
MNNTQLTWHTESRKVDSLLPHKKSPRKISKEQAERLKKSLENYGLVEIAAIDLRWNNPRRTPTHESSPTNGTRRHDGGCPST